MHQIISDSIVHLIVNGSKGLVAFIVLWILGAALSRFIRRNIVLHHHHAGIVEGLARTIKNICIFLGIVIFLKEIGIDIREVVAGLGLTGFALGFALKDTISNIVAGGFILMYRPFHIGDYILINADKVLAEGHVESIDFRYTILKSEKGTMLVPNSVLYTNPLTIKKNHKQ